jgi:aspartokinase
MNHNGKFKVLKFGGTSVGTPDRMRRLVKLITDEDSKIIGVALPMPL